MNNIQLIKTIYSLYYPESKKITKDLFNNPNSLKFYEKSFTEPKVQTESHIKFKEAWLKWASPQVSGLDEFYFYNTAGSSEAIRDSLANLKAEGCENIFVFKGEYEGFKALAESYKLNVIEINRQDFLNIPFNSLNGVFYISQPSSIDGNIWKDFDIFVDFIKNTQNSCKIRLDLCYLGTTVTPLKLNLNHSNIDMVFFSLSKVFGVYFHRIGGVFSREKILSLEGNKWFKNLLSLYLGIELLTTYNIDYIPKKYLTYQNDIIYFLNLKYPNINFIASDVIFLAYSNSNNFEQKYPDLKNMKRHVDLSHYRYCLTPLMDYLINNKGTL